MQSECERYAEIKRELYLFINIFLRSRTHGRVLVTKHRCNLQLTARPVRGCVLPSPRVDDLHMTLHSELVNIRNNKLIKRFPRPSAFFSLTINSSRQAGERELRQ